MGDPLPFTFTLPACPHPAVWNSPLRSLGKIQFSGMPNFGTVNGTLSTRWQENHTVAVVCHFLVAFHQKDMGYIRKKVGHFIQDLSLYCASALAVHFIKVMAPLFLQIYVGHFFLLCPWTHSVLLYTVCYIRAAIWKGFFFRQEKRKKKSFWYLHCLFLT